MSASAAPVSGRTTTVAIWLRANTSDVCAQPGAVTGSSARLRAAAIHGSSGVPTRRSCLNLRRFIQAESAGFWYVTWKISSRSTVVVMVGWRASVTVSPTSAQSSGDAPTMMLLTSPSASSVSVHATEVRIMLVAAAAIRIGLVIVGFRLGWHGSRSYITPVQAGGPGAPGPPAPR